MGMSCASERGRERERAGSSYVRRQRHMSPPQSNDTRYERRATVQPDGPNPGIKTRVTL